MNKINHFEASDVEVGRYQHEVSPGEDGLIDRMLPVEVFQKILFYLDKGDIASTDLVSHYWSKNAIEVAKHVDFFSRVDFVDFLVVNLKESSQKLLDIQRDKSIFKSASLRDVTLSTERSHEEISQVLSELNEIELMNLRKLYKFKSDPVFDHLIAVAELYKQFSRLHLKEERLGKVKRLQKISMRLIVYRKIDQAIEVASVIPDDLQKALTLQGISDALIQFGKMEKAITVARKIAKDYVQTETFEKICFALLDSGRLERSLEVARMILNYLDQSSVLIKMAEQLMNLGDIQNALKVAHCIPGFYYRKNILERIALLSCHDSKLEFISRDGIPICDQKRAV